MAVKKLQNMKRVKFGNSNRCGKRNFPSVAYNNEKKEMFCTNLLLFKKQKSVESCIVHVHSEFPVCLLEIVLY